jgi:RNA polymerase sigma factor (sigma-70 family)
MEKEVILPGIYEQLNGLMSKESALADPLWDSLKAGSYMAFEKIFKQYYPYLLNYGLKFNKDEDEIKDCIQILFLNIWERRELLGTTDSIRNYLLASLRRLVLKRMKAAIPFVDFDEDESPFHIELSVESQIIQDQTNHENAALLEAAISNLPDRQKEALYLKFYNDHSFSDISGIMNISTRAVYKLIYKALDSLNGELAPQSKYVHFGMSTLLTVLYPFVELFTSESILFLS